MAILLQHCWKQQTSGNPDHSSAYQQELHTSHKVGAGPPTSYNTDWLEFFRPATVLPQSYPQPVELARPTSNTNPNTTYSPYPTSSPYSLYSPYPPSSTYSAHLFYQPPSASPSYPPSASPTLHYTLHTLLPDSPATSLPLNLSTNNQGRKLAGLSSSPPHITQPLSPLLPHQNTCIDKPFMVQEPKAGESKCEAPPLYPLPPPTTCLHCGTSTTSL